MSYGLAAEAGSLLRKKARQDKYPLEIFLGAVIATVVFAISFVPLMSQLRKQAYYSALMVGPGLCCLLFVGLALSAMMSLRTEGAGRGKVIYAAAALGGTVAGFLLGDNTWWKYTNNYYNYLDMASYVNVDPGVDVGQSFMDAGTIYFKEGSFPLARKGLAFHNGATYCVAPIVRAPLQLLPGQSSPTTLRTATGFNLPSSGTIDFWAVGTNCCGKTGTDEPFTCGDAQSQIARSGARVLNNAERSMYVLAVQEWSASTGLPVRHPIFFKWSKDPISDQIDYYENAWYSLWLYLVYVFIVALIVCYCIQWLLGKLKVFG
mmetsp:Transcript_86916/g.243555  ORF Transcript_86916/g.243555 Transcript_86916/m.243555 type:complete len:319 (-) Transcript_86916:97-1053(-)|eukprot:CAMPEP_0117571316 /NCGR_PEP_ID=MMETSP0784-20121206/59680_1 /TAXON_ID=39447 /ORGANISM="" /LENGTH=318 /DNA_ID=CAMNT_0005369455 /DNA_START=28 /DNA_END=984 /DNA_ORIENTATION=+